MLTKKDVQDKKVDLSILSEKVEYEFKYLNTYVVHMNESITERIGILEGLVQSDFDSIIDEESDQAAIITNFYDHEISKLQSYFYHSSIVLIYTVLESSLNQICLELRTQTSSKLSLKDLAGGDIIKKSISFIKLIADVDFTGKKKLLERVSEFQKLRNDIVHRNSLIKGASKKDRENAAKILKRQFRSLVVDEETWNFHMEDDQNITEFMEISKNFILFVINDINSKIFSLDSTTQ